MTAQSRIPHFCAMCGNPLIEAIPEGENRLRAVCPRCGHIHYVNPLPVCGTIPVWEDKVLLCLRAIEPRRNYWTLPGGYLESNESSFDGAIKRGFIAFQIPSRESPVISPWFDGSQTQKHLILPDGNGSAYRKGIHIMNMAAPGANCPEAVFSLRNGFDKRISAHCAEMGNTGLSCHKNIRPDFFLTIRLAYV